ncbi:hypothetical protein ACNVED_02715 [Legionella sp. D16C41]|uniref:hypothetical protein n=1 Tax=Legionella sp. D16C41 TaxID=3402688 RepID=UPI003AF57C37
MDVFNELAERLENINEFKEFIDRQLELDSKFLERAFWLDGQQISVLNYLIQQHDPENKNLTAFIQSILLTKTNVYLHQPLHLILKLAKLDLLPICLAQLPPADFKQALNSYDITGQTILAHAINLGDEKTFATIMALNLDINQASEVTLENTMQGCLQPLYQAIACNFSYAVDRLLSVGASVENPCLATKEPALLLAAHLGAIDALKVLLNHPKSRELIHEQLNIRNSNGYTALELLCKRLQESNEPKQAIQGIAILLCHGAAVPSTEAWRNLLNSHRVALVKAVKEYTNEGAHPSIQFLRASHDKNNPLHEIIYTNKTWKQSVKNFFGIADRLAFKCEKIALADINKDKLDENERLFASFVKRYKESIKRATFYSPWSEMLWKISTGQINTWQGVCQYANEHPKTRTARIVEEMTKPQPEVYVNLTEIEEKASLSPLN